MFEKINYGDPVAYMDGEPIYSYFFKDEKGNLFSPVRQEVGYDESGVIYEDRPGKLIAPSNVMDITGVESIILAKNIQTQLTLQIYLT